MSDENKIEEKPSLSWLSFWREFIKLLNSFKKFFFVIIGFLIITTAIGIIKPYLLKLVIDGFMTFSDTSLNYLLLLSLFYLLSDQFRSLVQYFTDRKILRLLVEVEYFLNMKAQEKLIYLSLGYHEKENTGSKIIKIERGASRIIDFLGSAFWEFVPTIFQFIFTVAALFYADWRLAISFLFFAPLFIIITYFSNKHIYPIRKEMYADYEKASGKMAQSIININAVQSFVQEKKELNNFGIIRERVKNNGDKQWGWMMKVGLGRNLIVDLGRASILFIGAYLVFNNVISVGSLIFAFTLSEMAYSSLYRLSRFYDRIEEGREGVSRLINLFNADDGLEIKKTGLKPRTINGEIEFKNLSFAYGENKLKALNEVNLKIVPGSFTALIGPSGGGKTTIARLIYRHYDPQKGQVLLDGKDLRDYDLRSFRKFLAIVPQEVEIFDLTVAENIAYANSKASIEEIKAAAKIANADAFINNLDKGYDSLVGERGIKLSGGQRQRIGIARAILANPKVIIFDEATSNLDSESEMLIQAAIKKISRGRTMIVIAHRLSTIRQADKIIVLEKGRVVESGNHIELGMTESGLYAKLLKLQTGGDLR